MHPIICTIGPLTVFSYGAMLALAFAAASWLACRQAKREKFDPDKIFNFLFVSLVSGVLGARLFFVATHPMDYLERPLEIFMLSRGGLSWFGGFFSAVACGIIYLKKNCLPIGRSLDLVAPFLALAQAIGRIGCLLNGCCFGKLSPWGIYFPVQDAVLIPAQIYSSFLLLVIFLALRLIQEGRHKAGEVFLFYLLFYSLKRFFIEFWRADNPAIWGGLTLFQIFSAAVFFFAVAFLFKLHGKGDGYKKA